MSSIGTMNSVINNNRKLLKDGKRKPFSKSLGGTSKKSTYKQYVLPEVSPHVLRRVRIKMKRQNRRLLIKQLVIGFVTLVLMMLYIIYLSQ
ncbi:hypothetical protein [uncultured Psychroserpens sp.]|uniref:hypothetical protein n=1 Tax=uncultured Psychroserpens sp. TaxID=255436 RepID=UPI0026135F72|nr:hypothetical protein [uncultured Psychroserpens sp.]